MTRSQANAYGAIRDDDYGTILLIFLISVHSAVPTGCGPNINQVPGTRLTLYTILYVLYIYGRIYTYTVSVNIRT